VKVFVLLLAISSFTACIINIVTIGVALAIATIIIITIAINVITIIVRA
jgi:hypothetical protein